MEGPAQDTTGHSSPIVWEDRVFLTTAASQTREEDARKEIPDHDIACYRTGDGKLLWKTHVAHGPHQEGYAIYAVPTPVTDGKAVYVWFGSAVVVAVDFDGKLLWRHERPGPFSLNPGLCTSLRPLPGHGHSLVRPVQGPCLPAGARQEDRRGEVGAEADHGQLQ